MTVKEQLAARVARMSDEEAADTLRLLDQRSKQASVPSLGELLQRTRANSDLSADDAERIAAEEVRAMRRARRGAA